jgi:hypothetical protein
MFVVLAVLAHIFRQKNFSADADVVGIGNLGVCGKKLRQIAAVFLSDRPQAFSCLDDVVIHPFPPYKTAALPLLDIY